MRTIVQLEDANYYFAGPDLAAKLNDHQVPSDRGTRFRVLNRGIERSSRNPYAIVELLLWSPPPSPPRVKRKRKRPANAHTDGAPAAQRPRHYEDAKPSV